MPMGWPWNDQLSSPSDSTQLILCELGSGWVLDLSRDLSYVLDHEQLCVQLHGLERRGEEDGASLQPAVDVAGAAVMHSRGGRGKPLPGHAACRQHWCG